MVNPRSHRPMNEGTPSPHGGDPPWRSGCRGWGSSRNSSSRPGWYATVCSVPSREPFLAAKVRPPTLSHSISHHRSAAAAVAWVSVRADANDGCGALQVDDQQVRVPVVNSRTRSTGFSGGQTLFCQLQPALTPERLCCWRRMGASCPSFCRCHYYWLLAAAGAAGCCYTTAPAPFTPGSEHFRKMEKHSVSGFPGAGILGAWQSPSPRL